MPRKLMGKIDREKLEKCYDPNFKPGSGAEAPKAMTRTSNAFDVKGFLAEELVNPAVQRQNFLISNPTIACAMDVCTWFSSAAIVSGWPIINAERVEGCKTEEFKASLSNGLTPVDGLKTFGMTMLHEVSVSVIFAPIRVLSLIKA